MENQHVLGMMSAQQFWVVVEDSHEMRVCKLTSLKLSMPSFPHNPYYLLVVQVEVSCSN